MGATTDNAQMLSIAQMAGRIEACASRDTTQAMALAASETTSIAAMAGRITNEGGGSALHNYLTDKFSLTGATVTTEWNRDVLPGLTTAQANSNSNTNNGPDQTDFLRMQGMDEANRLNDAYLAKHPTHDAPHAEERLVATYTPQQEASFVRYYDCEAGNLKGAFVTDIHHVDPRASLALYANPTGVADVIAPPHEEITRSYVARSADNALQYLINPKNSSFDPGP
jgi:hypothetical protein